jgi:hypothetical protein
MNTVGQTHIKFRFAEGSENHGALIAMDPRSRQSGELPGSGFEFLVMPQLPDDLHHVGPVRIEGQLDPQILVQPYTQGPLHP